MWFGIKKTYWYIAGGLFAFLLLLSSCGSDNPAPVAVQPGSPSTVVVAPQNGSDGFMSGFMGGMLGGMLSGGNRSTHTETIVREKSYYKPATPSVAPTPAKPSSSWFSSTPKPSAPAATASSGVNRLGSAFRSGGSSGSSFRSFSGGRR